MVGTNRSGRKASVIQRGLSRWSLLSRNPYTQNGCLERLLERNVVIGMTGNVVRKLRTLCCGLYDNVI